MSNGLNEEVMRFSQPCENNKQVILAQLKHYFADVRAVLEIGSGTGQHSVHFAPALPHLQWYCSDLVESHPSIIAYHQAYPANNLHLPIEFQVGKHAWPQLVDGIFSANTAHIMQKAEVETMMAMISDNLPKGGVFCQYGPFSFDGVFTSESNRDFDLSLRERGYGGYCDLAQLKDWGNQLNLLMKVDMPANNHLLVWQKC